MNKLHLDALSDDALLQIVRNMSDHSRADDWQQIVAPEDVLSLVEVGRRFANASRTNFRALESRQRGGFKTSLYVPGGSSLLKVVVDSMSRASLLCELLAGLGDALPTLRIDFGRIPGTFSSSFLRPVPTNFGL